MANMKKVAEVHVTDRKKGKRTLRVVRERLNSHLSHGGTASPYQIRMSGNNVLEVYGEISENVLNDFSGKTDIKTKVEYLQEGDVSLGKKPEDLVKFSADIKHEMASLQEQIGFAYELVTEAELKQAEAEGELEREKNKNASLLEQVKKQAQENDKLNETYSRYTTRVSKIEESVRGLKNKIYLDIDSIDYKSIYGILLKSLEKIEWSRVRMQDNRIHEVLHELSDTGLSMDDIIHNTMSGWSEEDDVSYKKLKEDADMASEVLGLAEKGSKFVDKEAAETAILNFEEAEKKKAIHEKIGDAFGEKTSVHCVIYPGTVDSDYVIDIMTPVPHSICTGKSRSIKQPVRRQHPITEYMNRVLDHWVKNNPNFKHSLYNASGMAIHRVSISKDDIDIKGIREAESRLGGNIFHYQAKEFFYKAGLRLDILKVADSVHAVPRIPSSESHTREEPEMGSVYNTLKACARGTGVTDSAIERIEKTRSTQEYKNMSLAVLSALDQDDYVSFSEIRKTVGETLPELDTDSDAGKNSLSYTMKRLTGMGLVDKCGKGKRTEYKLSVMD